MTEPAPPYAQDIIAPVAVHHLVEYGDVSPDRPDDFGYWYNYIDYIFEEGGVTLRARHYFDEPGRALLLDRATMAAAAERLGITIIGLARV